MSSDTTKLRICAFCGGENLTIGKSAKGALKFIACDDCGGRTGAYASTFELRNAWNFIARGNNGDCEPKITPKVEKGVEL